MGHADGKDRMAWSLRGEKPPPRQRCADPSTPPFWFSRPWSAEDRCCFLPRFSSMWFLVSFVSMSPPPVHWPGTASSRRCSSFNTAA